MGFLSIQHIKIASSNPSYKYHPSTFQIHAAGVDVDADAAFSHGDEDGIQQVHQEQDNPKDFHFENISDEEALLACRAYLQRKNKLGSNGWTKHHKRKINMQKSLALGNNRPLSESNGALDEGIGYFWEDPTDLKYLRTGRPRLYFDNGVDEFVTDFMREHDDDDDNELDWLHGRKEEKKEDDDVENSVIVNKEDSSVFTGFPTMPTKEFSTRSNSKKALFQNEEWKRKWYEARWGNLAEERQERRKEKKIKKFIKQIPNDVLRSEELAALSDAEIEGAVRTYIVANKRRSRAQHNRMKIKRNMLLSNTLDKEDMRSRDTAAAASEASTSKKTVKRLKPTLDSFMMQLNGSSEVNGLLADQMQRRSERATMAYQTRIQHIMDSKMKPTPNSEYSHAKKAEYLPKRVDAALHRIKRALDESLHPKSADIEIILEPKRLSGRKDLFKDILLKCFGMRGKCVPDLRLEDGEFKKASSSADTSDVNKMEKKFVTTCSVLEVGHFVAHKLREVEDR
jgi:hypothetical protein